MVPGKRQCLRWAAPLLIFALPVLAADAPEWPGWAGPRGDFTTDAGALAESWPAAGPKRLWERPLGAGYSSILYRDDRLFTMYRQEQHWKTGKVAWMERGFHKAQALWADQKFLFLAEDGKLALTRVSPEKIEILASHPVALPHAWTLPTLISTTLYLRDHEKILALDLGRPAPAPH